MNNLTSVVVPLAFLHRNTMPDNTLLIWAHLRFMTEGITWWPVNYRALEVVTGVPQKACSQAIVWLEGREMIECRRPGRGKLEVLVPEPGPHWEQVLENRLKTVEEAREMKANNDELVARSRQERIRSRQ